MKKLLTLALAPALAMSVLTGCGDSAGSGGGKTAGGATVELTLEGLKQAATKAGFGIHDGKAHANTFETPVDGFCMASKKNGSLNIQVNEFVTPEGAQAQSAHYFEEMKKWDHNMFIPKTSGKFSVVFTGDDAKKVEKKVMAAFQKAGWVDDAGAPKAGPSTAPASIAAKPAPGLTLAAIKAAAERAEAEFQVNEFDCDKFDFFGKNKAPVNGFNWQFTIELPDGLSNFGVEFAEFANDADALASQAENEKGSIPEMNIIYGRFLARTGFSSYTEGADELHRNFITKIFEDAIANPVKESN